jgi:tripartite-type tricarboxylate transporter receptor subunit TctC
LSPVCAQSTTFPAKSVTHIVPFAPGATTDVLGRLIGQKLAETWGQPVVVENRAGASGTIGLGAVAKAPADGHTIGMMIVSNATHAAMQGARAPIDLIKDFAPVTHAASQPYLLLVNASLPARTVRELVALARARPGALTYGSSGVGSVLHLAGELLAAQTKVKLTHVPYKGAAPALSDVAGGHIAMLFTTRVTAQSLLANGKVRALAVTSKERMSGLPDVPTVQESGVTGPFEVTGWYGVSTAAGVPATAIERLNAEINRVLKLPEVRERMQADGTVTTGSTPAQFGEFVRGEIERWRRIIQQAGISPAAG